MTRTWRRSTLAIVAALLLTAGCGTNSVPAIDVGTTRAITDDDITGAVLQLRLDGCRHGIGTLAAAVAIGEGRALTVAHAFDGVESFVVVDADGAEFGADIVYLDREKDIAVLEFQESPALEATRTGLPISTDESDTSVRLAIPSEDGPSVHPAQILRRVIVKLDGVGRRSGLELEGDIARGDSGSPVLDDRGAILGIVFAASRGDERGWAVAASELLTPVDQAGGPIALSCDEL